MPTTTNLRLVMGAILASAVATAGCDAFSSIFGGPPKSTKKSRAAIGLTRHSATVPINKDTQIASVKGGIEAVKTTLSQTSSGLSDSYTKALVSPQTKYALSSLMHTLGIKSTVVDSRGTEVSYDAATHQITKVKSGNFEITADVRGGGKSARGADIVLVRSQDGTIGQGSFTIDTEKWLDASKPTDTTSTPPPFELFYNQYPDMAVLAHAECKVAVDPQGDASRRVEFAGGADDFKQPQGLLKGFGAPSACAPGTWDKITGEYTPGVCSTPDPAKAPRFPHKVYTKGKVPKFEYDQSFIYSSTGETSGQFEIKGDFNLETDKGWNSWTISNVAKGDSKLPGASVMEVNWENVTMKYKFTGTFKPYLISADKKQASGFILEGTFASTVDDSKLAEIKYTSDDATKRTNPKIEFTNGDTFELKLKDFMPVMPVGAMPLIPEPVPTRLIAQPPKLSPLPPPSSSATASGS